MSPVDKSGSPLLPQRLQVLDRLLVYLRVVHSVDYYNHSEYASEDEMPNRCGIMHARGSPPSSKVTPQEGEYGEREVAFEGNFFISLWILMEISAAIGNASVITA